jgi:hypothetical protein
MEGGEYHVVLASDKHDFAAAIEELRSPEAKALAIQEAQKRMSRPGIAGQVGPYPTDVSGSVVEHNTAPAAYAVKYRLVDGAV